MNLMIRAMVVAALVIGTTSCKRIIKEEPYLAAQTNPPLKPVAGKDLPRTNNALNIPVVKAESTTVAPDTMPPEMTFARKRSSDENVVIIESGGMPTIEIFNDKKAWDLMLGDHGFNWQLLDEDKENCQATFRFYDPITDEVEQGFFKRLFQVNSSYIDRSGDYILTCLELPQKQQIWLQTLDFEAPSAYVVDDLFSHIFEAATAD